MENNNNTKNASLMDWFDLSAVGVYIAPELVCGRPCVLLLDTTLVFGKNNLVSGKLEEYSFQPIEFEFHKSEKVHIYILFTETLSSDLFYRNLCYPKNTIRQYRATLQDIQSVFYAQAKHIFNFRVDTLIKSSIFLGLNHQDNQVYESMFGRYRIATLGVDSEPSFLMESNNERNLAYLRANTPEDVLHCCEGYIREAIKTRRNISLNDAVNFANILFQDMRAPKMQQVKPHHLLMVLNVFTVLYIKNILPVEKSVIRDIHFYKNRDIFKTICLNAEACPSQPRAVYTDEFASQYSTPLPIAFIMQKLLIDGDAYEKEDCEVLDPMFGYGALTNFLCVRGYSVLGIEKNLRKVNLVKSQQYDNLRLECADGVNGDYYENKIAGTPFRYIISSPACLKNHIKYEYSDENSRKETDRDYIFERTDLIMTLKSLKHRADHGRSVILLPYFTDLNIGFAKTQDDRLESLLRFIHSRYKIEGLAQISSEIYSKSLRKISPLILVIGAKREKFEPVKGRLLNWSIIPAINDYESLWDYSSLVCYKRSPYFESDKQDYAEALEALDTPTLYHPDAEIEWQESTGVAAQAPSEKLDASNDLFNFSATPAAAIETETEAAPVEEQDDIDLIMSEGETDLVQAESETATDSSAETETEAETDESSTAQAELETDESSTAQAESETGTETSALGDTPEDEPAQTEGTETTHPNSNLLLNDEQLSENDSKLLIKGDTKDKITKSKGNLFALNAQNQIIRYHSTATLSEPTSNVHQSEFAAYLSGKKNLLNQIDNTIRGAFMTLEQDQLYEPYMQQHKLEPSVEAFIGANLKLGSPKEFNGFFKSEHYDLIAASILKFNQKKSLLVLDSIGMNTDVVFSSLMHFNRVNHKGSVFVAKDEAAIDHLVKTYTLFSEQVLKAPVPEFIIAHRHKNPVGEICRFHKDAVLIVLNDPKFISQLRGKLKSSSKTINSLFGASAEFGVFFDFDMSATKYSSSLITQFLKAPTLFRSHKFIDQDTNLGVLSNIFSKNVYSRYFTPKMGALDEMTCYLLKIGLIEELTLFQRFEDLSNIAVREADVRSIWGGKYEVLAQSFSTTINNIVLLAEDIQRDVHDKDSRFAMIRAIAIKLFELSSFCISSVPLTYSIFTAVKNHSKPVVVVPKNTESLLYDLMGSLNVPIPEHHPDLGITSFAELNALIEAELEKARLQDGESKQVDALKQLLQLRIRAVLEYFTYLKNGKISKYPDITGLISAFYRSCMAGLHEGAENYADIKKRAAVIELEIGALADLPLCIIDFIRYELEQHQMKCGEISARTNAIEYSKQHECWRPSEQIPLLSAYDSSHSKAHIAHQFNSGDLDVLFVEAEEIYGLDLSSNPSNLQSLDYMRKRVLMLTYFNKPIQHYLTLIHSINHPQQMVSPDIHFEVPETPIQQMMFRLVAQQLGLFNIQIDTGSHLQPDLSYYLTVSGQKLLVEYLNLNPSYQAHYPNTPIQQWDIYHVLNIANMVDSSLQNNIIEHLGFLARQNLAYLRSEKANPFDLFTVSHKANINNHSLSSGVGYLNKRLTEEDGVFSKPIQHATLSYLKDSSNSFTLDLCRAIHKNQAHLEETRLKTIIANQFQDNSLLNADHVKHSDCLALYIQHYTTYLITVYRDKIINTLQDRYRKWIFVSPNRLHQGNHIRSHFIGPYGLQVSNTLDDLYFEILMLADSDLVTAFEKSCEILSFLKAYHLTILNQEKSGVMSPILLPIPSPFNDRSQQISEGLMMGINFPTSLMISLTPKSFSVTMCYPSKSKPIDLNLAYILEHPDVLKKQNVLSNIPQNNAKFILKAYRNSKFKDLLAKKIKELNFAKITELTDLEKLSALRHHKTIQAFSQSRGVKKIRSMNVLYGNLFDIYYLLKNQLPLTMISFTNEAGLTHQGFVTPSDTDFGSVIEGLVRVSNISNIQFLYGYFKSKNNNFRSLRGIQWVGESGKLDACNFSDKEVELNFIGSVERLQKIFLDKDIFKEYPVVVQYDEMGEPMEHIEVPEELESYNFTPLDLLVAKIHRKGKDMVYTFYITHQQFKELIILITKKRSYDVALLDCVEVGERIALAKKINNG